MEISSDAKLAAMTGCPEDFSRIRRRYLAVQNIPYFVDFAGRLYFERSWHRDLTEHLRYLCKFTLAAPLHPLPADTKSLVPLNEELRARLEIVALPALTSRFRALVHLPKTFWLLWRAVGRAEIVHSGIAGWPYPMGWLANPIAQLRGKKRLVIVESAPWRLVERNRSATTLKRKIEAYLHESFARHWCSTADLSFYTQPAYLEQFHRRGRGPAFVTPASWVNAEDILTESQAQSLWDVKLNEPVHFLFAGRLVEEKGIRILLEAVNKIAAAGVHGALHVIGQGPLREAVVATQGTRSFSLRYFEPVPYGEPFLTFIQRYHALVIPSLSDEQPRVVFDAAARAVPVLAAATDGIRPHVEDNRTGKLIAPGNSDALAEAITLWATKPGILREFGIEALSRVRGKTHQAMHSERSRIIALHLDAASDKGSSCATK
jgi:glycosyltransferase involved in cell wall biosynthesis